MSSEQPALIQKLVLMSDGLVLKEIALEGKQRLSIGRRQNNDIQIDNFAISGEHAVVTVFGSDVFIEDLDSTNGVTVNGKAIRRHQLKANDSVGLAKYVLKYVNEVDQTANAITVNKDSLSWDPEAARSAAQSAQAEPLSAAELGAINIGTPSIRVIKGASKGKGMELIKRQTTLGRPGLLVVSIDREDNGYYLTYIEGSERPTINNTPLLVDRKRLQAGDIINVAGSEMEFYFKT